MTFYTAEYGIKHIETVNTMNKLAGVLMLLGKHSEAYPLLRNAKDVRELLLGAILCIPQLLPKQYFPDSVMSFNPTAATTSTAAPGSDPFDTVFLSMT